MPAVRHIETCPGLGAAIVAARDNTTGHEVWLVDPDATADAIVTECSVILQAMNERCAQITHAGQRRALWLFLAVVAGLVLPSPLRHLYGEGRLLHAAEGAGCVAVVVLLGLALREHLGIRCLQAGRD